MGVVDDPVEDRVGDGGFADHLMPARARELGGDDGGAPLVAFFEQLQQVETLLIGQTVRAPVVEDQKLHAGELVDQAREAAIEPGGCHLLEQARHTRIGDGVIHTRRLMGEGAGQPGLSSAGLAGEDDLLMGLEPPALGQRQDLAAIEATRCCKVDVFGLPGTSAPDCI